MKNNHSVLLYCSTQQKTKEKCIIQLFKFLAIGNHSSFLDQIITLESLPCIKGSHSSLLLGYKYKRDSAIACVLQKTKLAGSLEYSSLVLHYRGLRGGTKRSHTDTPTRQTKIQDYKTWQACLSLNYNTANLMIRLRTIHLLQRHPGASN